VPPCILIGTRKRQSNPFVTDRLYPFWHTVMIFQLIEFIDVTVFVTGGTLFVTGPHPTRKMITLRLVS
jgi:hypothetical protein